MELVHNIQHICMLEYEIFIKMNELILCLSTWATLASKMINMQNSTKRYIQQDASYVNLRNIKHDSASVVENISEIKTQEHAVGGYAPN